MLAAACGVSSAAADPVTIGWPELRPADGGQCDAAHVLMQMEKVCLQPADPMVVLRCGTQTVDLTKEPVRIAGYVHPLDMTFKGLTEFILMPPLAPCRHPPAPMANQIIRVSSAVPIDVSFDPVFVTGVIRAELNVDGLTPIRYRMNVTKVEPALIPDVRP